MSVHEPQVQAAVDSGWPVLVEVEGHDVPTAICETEGHHPGQMVVLRRTDGSTEFALITALSFPRGTATLYINRQTERDA